MIHDRYGNIMGCALQNTPGALTPALTKQTQMVEVLQEGVVFVVEFINKGEVHGARKFLQLLLPLFSKKYTNSKD